jgi:hypothetical protein
MKKNSEGNEKQLLPIERLTRRGAARLIQRRALIPEMIDRIKSILRVDAPSPESQVGEV